MGGTGEPHGDILDCVAFVLSFGVGNFGVASGLVFPTSLGADHRGQGVLSMRSKGAKHQLVESHLDGGLPAETERRWGVAGQAK